MNERVTRKSIFGAAAVAGAALAALAVPGAAHAQGQVLSPNRVPAPSTFNHKAPPGMFPQTPRGFFPESRQSAIPQVRPNFQGAPVLPRGYLVPQGYTYYITPQGITAFPQYYGPYGYGGFYFIRPAR